jgi:hypothetical protein
MKVEFSYRDYTLFSRYLQLKVHIVIPDSNLVALKSGSLGRLSLSGKSKRDSKGSAVAQKTEKHCAHAAAEHLYKKNSIFSATTDSILFQFRFSRPT